MPQLNTYGDITPKTAGGMTARMLKVAGPQAITSRFGQVDPIKRNAGDAKVFTRYKALRPATAPVQDGVTPSGQAIRKDDITCRVREYGDYVPLTNRIQDLHTDPVVQQMSDRMGDQIIDTTELVNIAVLRAGTNVVRAGGAASRSAINATASRGDIRLIERALRRQKSKPVTKMIKAGMAISTQPVDEAFIGMTHTDAIADLKDVSGFTPVAEYADSDKRLPYEIGKIECIRILATPNFEPWLQAGQSGSTYLTNGISGTGNADVYYMVVVGMDAYGTVPLAGEDTVKPMVLQPGVPREGDPLGQRGYISWRKYHGCVRLNELWMLRYEFAVTANPN